MNDLKRKYLVKRATFMPKRSFSYYTLPNKKIDLYAYPQFLKIAISNIFKKFSSQPLIKLQLP